MLRIHHLLLASLLVLAAPDANADSATPIPRQRMVHDDCVRLVLYNPDGKTLVSVTIGSVHPPHIYIWDVRTGRALARFKVQTITVQLSPDGKTIAARKSEHEIGLWDAQTGKEFAVCKGAADVQALAFSADSAMLATGSKAGSIKLWDVKTGAERATFQEDKSAVWLVAFNPDGQTLLAARDDGRILLLEVPALRERRSFTVPKGQGTLSSDGATLAMHSKGGAIQLWDVAAGKVKFTLEGQEKEVYSLRFSANGRRLAAHCEDRVIKLWDVASGKVVTTLPGLVFALSPDGQLLASGGRESHITLWDAKMGQVRHLLQSRMHHPMSLAFSPDGQTLASAGYHDCTVKLWDAGNGQEWGVFYDEHLFYVHALAYSPDGQILAASGGDITLWDVRTGVKIDKLARHAKGVFALVFSRDGRWLASAGGDNTIRLWDVQRRQLKYTIADTRGAPSFSPDGKTLAAGSADKTIKLWDVEKRAVRAVFKADAECSVLFSPDGKLLAAWDQQGTVTLWEVQTGAVQARFKGIATYYGSWTTPVNPVAFSRDGSQLATVHAKAIKLWDTRTGQERNTFEGHTEMVHSVVFSPDGQRLASVSRDHTIKLWHAQTSKELASMRWNHVNGPMVGLTFSPDGRTLASSSRSIYLWDVSPEE